MVDAPRREIDRPCYKPPFDHFYQDPDTITSGGDERDACRVGKRSTLTRKSYQAGVHRLLVRRGLHGESWRAIL